jgi:DegV family protein with EDD domain
MGKNDAGRLHILDLGSVGIGLGLMGKKAVGLLNQGVPAAQLQDKLAPFRQMGFFSFTLDNLMWLKKGDRVNAFEAFLGNMLNYRPIIELRDARLEPVERYRGKKQALAHLVSRAQETYEKYNGNCDIWLAYADNLEEVMHTREKLAAAVGKPAESILLAEVGATIAAHTGPGSSVCIHAAPVISRGGAGPARYGRKKRFTNRQAPVDI